MKRSLFKYLKAIVKDRSYGICFSLSSFSEHDALRVRRALLPSIAVIHS